MGTDEKMDHEFTEKTLSFLGSLGVVPKRPTFYLEVNFDAKGSPSNVYSSATDTVIRLVIRNTEWSVYVNKPRKGESHVRVLADGPFVHGQDAFKLLHRMPAIAELPRFIRDIEKELGVKFPRIAFVRTNIAGGKKAIASWVTTL